MAAGASLGLLVVLIVLVALGVTHVFASRTASPPRVPQTAASTVATSESGTSSDAALAALPPDPAADADASATASDSGEPSATITVAAVGDMVFDRAVKQLIESQGGSAPLKSVAKQLSSADVTVGNLESMLSDNGSPASGKSVTFAGDPTAIEGLSAAGFDFLSVANNHTLDYGPRAMLDTIAGLDKAGIGHAGAGKNRAAAWTPAAAEKNGATVAYLAFSHVVPSGWQAQPNAPGVASGRYDMALLEKAIRDAKKTHDYVIVSFHWGNEYDDTANDEQITDGHKAIDAGADLVVASHPHVIQGVESYSGRLIAYSLGNFVFDHTSKVVGESFILNVTLTPDGVAEATVVPVYLDTHGSPAVVKGAEARSILTRLRRLSAPLGGKVVIDGDTARIEL